MKPPNNGPKVSNIAERRQAALAAIEARYEAALNRADSISTGEVQPWRDDIEQAGGRLILALPSKKNHPRIKRALKQIAIAEQLRRGRKRRAYGDFRKFIEPIVLRLLSSGVPVKPKRVALMIVNSRPKVVRFVGFAGDPRAYFVSPKGKKIPYKSFSETVLAIVRDWQSKEIQK